MKSVSAMIAGIVFGYGLAISGMTDTEKVVGFLDIFGQWDPDLIFVMGAAVLTTAIGFSFLFSQRKTPFFNSGFLLPTKKLIDRKLLIGASLFGVGWGLYGYCPGPAIASVIYFSPVTFLFIFSMIIGMFFGNTISNKIAE